METILASEFAVQIVYPFLLVFVLIFAILQKSKILGDGKAQIDALISLAVALIVVSIGWATQIITMLMPFLAIGVVVLLMLFVLLGFTHADPDKPFDLPKGLKYGIWTVAIIFIIIAIIVATGQWDVVWGFLFKGTNVDNFWGNFLLVAIIVGAIAAVVFGGKKDEETE